MTVRTMVPALEPPAGAALKSCRWPAAMAPMISQTTSSKDPSRIAASCGVICIPRMRRSRAAACACAQIGARAWRWPARGLLRAWRPSLQGVAEPVQGIMGAVDVRADAQQRPGHVARRAGGHRAAGEDLVLAE